ncbi:lycopene cyclase family protein [Streptomyces sp. LP05-1]|uniref:Lycopene cyclase family protein n=1 Tax=Streptomyces pyxinae TaxID=2970734 RepID=A0ABT2CNY8_9ACTN|nr:lycopene cyclase family protein [Streptomyces sp. LP05-1]MCS0638401.1 lycopene cyclase family protein [Streptomyces sp. LP05-1]
MAAEYAEYADVVIVGAGAAGLSLADALTAPGAGRPRSVTLVEAPDGPLRPPERTWCFWEAGEGPYEDAVAARWDLLRVHAPDGTALDGAPAPLTYKMIRSARFTELVGARLAARPGVRLLRATVERIRDLPAAGDRPGDRSRPGPGARTGPGAPPGPGARPGREARPGGGLRTGAGVRGGPETPPAPEARPRPGPETPSGPEARRRPETPPGPGARMSPEASPGPEAQAGPGAPPGPGASPGPGFGPGGGAPRAEVVCAAPDGRRTVLRARWVYDSRPPAALPPARTTLLQHFRGWFVRTARPAFDPAVATLMDFRVPRPAHGLAFGYVLPLGEREALVEYTEFSRRPLSRPEYDEALGRYAAGALGLGAFEVTAAEQGVIPMTDARLPRRTGSGVFRIGAAGGATRPATGYTFAAVQRQSAAIAAGLRAGRDRPPPPPHSRRALAMDAVLLRALDTGRIDGPDFFARLFGSVPFDRMLRFLDGGTRLREDLSIGFATPVVPMLRTAAELPFLRRTEHPVPPSGQPTPPASAPTVRDTREKSSP